MNEIKNFMTATPHAIGRDQSIKLAQERMHQFGVRHLPVLDGGALAGVISERDIALASAISSQRADGTTVEEVMSAEPYEVGPDTAVDVVAEHMAKHKQDCAVVIEHQKVIGVFTTIDALELLTVMLRENKQPSPAQPPQPPQSLAKAAGKKQK